MALSFKLICSNATIPVQVKQIEQGKAAGSKCVKKKAGKMRLKVEMVDESV